MSGQYCYYAEISPDILEIGDKVICTSKNGEFITFGEVVNISSHISVSNGKHSSLAILRDEKFFKVFLNKNGTKV